MSDEKINCVDEDSFCRFPCWLEFREKTSNNEYIDSKLCQEYSLRGILKKEINDFINPNLKKQIEFCKLRDKNENDNPIKCFNWIAYVDLVGFKPFNDYLSEASGDTILAFAVEFLNRKMGKQFLIVRKGGEEFNLYYMDNISHLCADKYKTYLNGEYNVDRIDDNTERKYIVSQCKVEFKKQEMCLYTPKRSVDSDDEGLQKRKLKFNFDYRLEVKPLEGILFRLFIRGLDFRFGLGYTENEAAEDGQKSKDEEKREGEYPNRGSFGKSVEFGVFGKKLNKDYKEEAPEEHWFAANDYVLLMYPNKQVLEDDSAQKLCGKIKEVLIKYVVDLIYDDVYGVTYVVAKFPQKKGITENDTDRLKEIKKVGENLKDSNEVEAKLVAKIYEELLNPNKDDNNVPDVMLKLSADVIREMRFAEERKCEVEEALKVAGNILETEEDDNDEINLSSVLEPLIDVASFDTRGAFLRYASDLLLANLRIEECGEIYTLSGETIRSKYYK